MKRPDLRELALFLLVGAICASASCVCALIFECAPPPHPRSVPLDPPEVHR